VTVQRPVSDLAKLVWRASMLIEKEAERLEAAGRSTDDQRQWLADYWRTAEQGKGRRKG
jgi:hypothetical protein